MQANAHFFRGDAVYGFSFLVSGISPKKLSHKSKSNESKEDRTKAIESENAQLKQEWAKMKAELDKAF